MKARARVATEPQAATTVAAPAATTTRRRAAAGSRAPQGPRTIYVVLQVMGEDGQPIAFDKRKVKLLAIDSSADAMLSVAEDDANPNAFFIRGKLARRTRAAAATPGAGTTAVPRAA